MLGSDYLCRTQLGRVSSEAGTKTFGKELIGRLFLKHTITKNTLRYTTPLGA